MAAILIFRNSGDKSYPLENQEMLATNVSNNKFEKCWLYMFANKTNWRYMFANTIFRNVGDKR